MADGKSYRVTDLDKGKGAYALVDLEFLCGCELSCQNGRTNALQLRKQYGLELVIGGMNSWPERRKNGLNQTKTHLPDSIHAKIEK